MTPRSISVLALGLLLAGSTQAATFSGQSTTETLASDPTLTASIAGITVEFSDFTLVSDAAGGATEIDPADVDLTAGINLDNNQPALEIAFDTLDVLDGEAIDAVIQFEVTVLTGDPIQAVQMMLNGIASGAASVSETVFVDDDPVAELDTVITETISVISASDDVDPPEFTLTIRKDFSVVSFGDSSRAAIFDVVQTFVVPEPSTYAAIFGGVALLAAIIYRRKRG